MNTVENDQGSLARLQREQMLKLVTKAFYNELVNYGVAKPDILTITSHLLDNIMQQDDRITTEEHHYHNLFTTRTIVDEWKENKRFSVGAVSIRPLAEDHLEELAVWLAQPNVRGSFITPYPDNVQALARYFAQPGRLYFSVSYEEHAVGIIGAENIDRQARRLEMRKLVGSSVWRGKGIGKRATFGFLYYVFQVLGFEKVYIHSTDVNIRNLNLNSHFGFQLEGVFLQEIMNGTKRQDVVRMGLRRPHWLEIFDGREG